MRREAFINDGATPTETNAHDILVWDTTRYTNWQEKAIGGTALATDIQATESGGYEKTQFFVEGTCRRATMVYPGHTADRSGADYIHLHNQNNMHHIPKTLVGL